MRLAFISIVIVFFLIAQCAYAQESYREHLRMGKFSFNDKDYAAAEQQFRAALAEQPDGYEAMLYLGIVLNRAGKPREAAVLLKKALFLDPENQLANLEMGIFYFNKALYLEAIEFFEIARDLDPTSAAAGTARQYLDGIRTEFDKEPEWEFTLSTGIQHDSNVVLSPETGVLPAGISRKADWRGTVFFTAGYDLFDEEGIAGRFGYSLYQSVHARLSEFNVTSSELRLDLFSEARPGVKVAGSYSYELSYVAWDKYGSSHTLSPSVTIGGSGGASSVVEFRYKILNFSNMDFFPNNFGMSGTIKHLGFSRNIPLGGSVAAKLGAFYEAADAKRKYWDYGAYGATAAAAVNLPLKFTARASVEYSTKDYDGINPVSARKRDDETLTYSLAMRKDFSKKLNILAGYTVVDNDSSIAEYAYKREISTLALSMRF